MKALEALLGSEKGFLCVLIIIGATVLAALGVMAIDQWISMTEIIFGTYVVGKTVQGATTVIANAKKAPAPAPAEPTNA